MILIYFVVFSLSILGWGRILSRSQNLTECLLYGTLFYISVPNLLSLFSALDQRWIPIVLCIAPLPMLRKFRISLPKIRFSPEGLLILSFCLLFLCRIFEGAILHPHGDPLYYDLLSAAMWSRMGSISFIPDLPLLFQSSWWDYIYLWPTMFFQTEANKGLIETQIFCQWLHLFVGFGGTLLAWNQILLYVGYNQLTRLLSTMVIATTASMWWSATLAKNDWGATFLFLMGINFFLRSQVFVAGIVLGIAISAKWTTIPIFIGLGLAFYSNGRKDLTKIIAGICLGMLPIVVRNLYFVGEPFFPVTVTEAGKQFLSKSFIEYLRLFSPGFSERDWGTIFNTRWRIVFESPFVWIGPLVLLFKKSDPFASRIYLGTLAGFVIFTLISGPWAENRLFGPGLLLLAGSGALLACAIHHSSVSWLFVAIALVTSRIPTHMPEKFLREFPQSIEQMNSGDLKIKIQATIPPGSRILTSGDNELYYLSDYKISDVLNNPTIDKIARENDLFTALKKIKDSGYQFLLHSVRHDGSCWPGFCEQLNSKIDEVDGVVLRGKKGVLIDLSKSNF